MRARTAAEDAVLASDDYYTEHQLLVADTPDADPTIPGLTVYNAEAYFGEDPLIKATITADLENPLVQAAFTLHLGTGSKSLSPYMIGGLNVGGRPLFDAGRYLMLNTRTVGRYSGAPPAWAMPWRPVFSGRIDTSDPGGEDDTLIVSCRDFYSDWMDRQIEPALATGSWPIAAGTISGVLTYLISLFAADWIGPPRTVLEIVGSPGLAIPAYNQEPGSGLLALRAAALLNGWDLRGRFNDLDQWQMVYREPDRALTGPQLMFGPGRQLAFHGLAKSRDEVRNRVSVTPADPPRAPQIVEDVTSILKYNKKALGVAEDTASRIRTPAQALVLAQAILADTKEPKRTAVVDMNYQPLIEVNDVLRLSPNNVQYDGSMTLAVSGYTHTFAEDGSVVTQVSTRDLPAAANSYWRRDEPIMEYRSFDPPSGVAAEGATWTQYKSVVQ
jgi:hypothetical protein